MRNLILVAAVDAPGSFKGIADFQCDGIHDEVELQVAFDDAAAFKTQPILSTGTFHISGAIIVP